MQLTGMHIIIGLLVSLNQVQSASTRFAKSKECFHYKDDFIIEYIGTSSATAPECTAGQVNKLKRKLNREFSKGQAVKNEIIDQCSSNDTDTDKYAHSSWGDTLTGALSLFGGGKSKLTCLLGVCPITLSNFFLFFL